ncbi:MAG: DUF6249 domain-containing protein [Bacteroidia bacterium]
MSNAEDIIIPLAVFATIFGILYVYFTTRHKERLALIEKGADASLFQSKRNYRFHSLKAGMFLAGIGLGILFGNILDVTTQLKEEVAYFSMVFLCGGLSLILFYLYEKKMSRE